MGVLAALAGGLAVAEPAPSAPLERELTLAECIMLAIRSSRDLAAGRLDRLAGRLSLADRIDFTGLASRQFVFACESSLCRQAYRLNNP